MQSEKSSHNASLCVVVIPRDLAEMIRGYLSEMQKEGTFGEGWKVEKLFADINALEDVLGVRCYDMWNFSESQVDNMEG